MKLIETEKEGKKREVRKQFRQKQEKKIIHLKIKENNNSISHCINYTRGCSIMHLQSNVTDPWRLLLSAYDSSLCMIDTLYTQQWHYGKSPCVSRWPGVDGIVFQPLQLNHNGVSSSCSWILTQKCSFLILFEHVYFMCVCVCVACIACHSLNICMHLDLLMPIPPPCVSSPHSSAMMKSVAGSPTQYPTPNKLIHH